MAAEFVQELRHSINEYNLPKGKKHKHTPTLHEKNGIRHAYGTRYHRNEHLAISSDTLFA